MNNSPYRPKYITDLTAVSELSQEEHLRLLPVTDKFVFRTNDYYQSLIDWNDPDDPIRRIIMPDVQEMDEYGVWDASDEASYTVAKGLEHKYRDTVLLLVNNVCGGYCRFCFRKRLFTQENDETTNDISGAVDYITRHPEITNVVLSGGDPLIMSTARLETILTQLFNIPHVKILRIGTKLPAFNPFRITGDPSLIELLRGHASAQHHIYAMAHFNHPRELTGASAEGLAALKAAGVTIYSQTPMIHGVNDDPAVLSNLFQSLSMLGVVPYYVFVCRPTLGNKTYSLPVERALDVFLEAIRPLSGVARTARLCMSHSSGKIEIIGRHGDQILFRRHRSPDANNVGELLLYRSNPSALWLDDYIQVEQ